MAPVSSLLRRDLRRLLNQQCWCWGCDVRRPGGNLLLAHGAERLRPLGGDRRRSTTYHVAAPCGLIALWGFGLAVVPAEGLAVFVPRYQATPRPMSGRADLLRRSWSPCDLPLRERVDSLPAWWSALSAFRWIASYEKWIAATADAGWRVECLRRFEASVVAGDAQRAAWDDLADRLEAALLDVSVRIAGGAARTATASGGFRAAAGIGSDSPPVPGPWSG